MRKLLEMCPSLVYSRLEVLVVVHTHARTHTNTHRQKEEGQFKETDFIPFLTCWVCRNVIEATARGLTQLSLIKAVKQLLCHLPTCICISVFIFSLKPSLCVSLSLQLNCDIHLINLPLFIQKTWLATWLYYSSHGFPPPTASSLGLPLSTHTMFQYHYSDTGRGAGERGDGVKKTRKVSPLFFLLLSRSVKLLKNRRRSILCISLYWLKLQYRALMHAGELRLCRILRARWLKLWTLYYTIQYFMLYMFDLWLFNLFFRYLKILCVNRVVLLKWEFLCLMVTNDCSQFDSFLLKHYLWI